MKLFIFREKQDIPETMYPIYVNKYSDNYGGCDGGILDFIGCMGRQQSMAVILFTGQTITRYFPWTPKIIYYENSSDPGTPISLCFGCSRFVYRCTEECEKKFGCSLQSYSAFNMRVIRK